MRKSLFVLAGLAILAGTARAQIPQDSHIVTPQSPYAVTPQAGNWFIIVGSFFTGEQSRQLAEGLVEEIRRDYKLPAYVFNKGAEEREKEKQRVAALVEQQRKFIQESGAQADTPIRVKKFQTVEDQYAVLVGGYKDMDAARKALDDIKKLKPPSEKYMNKHTVVTPAGENGGKATVSEGHVSPFLASFVVPNPTIPRQKDPEKDKPDANLKEYNDGESFSLLKCKKPYTLVVKTYSGAAQISSRSGGGEFLSKIGMNKGGELLNASAQQAHSMAELLKKMGYESYVLHTRTNSLVTIGGFDSEQDPRLIATQRSLAQTKLTGLSEMDRLYANPVPMAIPRP
jgi:hypothetical protein